MRVKGTAVPKGAVIVFMEIINYPWKIITLICQRLYEQIMTTSNSQILHSSNKKVFEVLSACQSFWTFTVAFHIWEAKRWEHDRLTGSGFPKFNVPKCSQFLICQQRLKQPKNFIEISRQRKTKGPKNCWSFTAQVTVPVTTASTAHSMIIQFSSEPISDPFQTPLLIPSGRRLPLVCCHHGLRDSREKCPLQKCGWPDAGRILRTTENTHKNEQFQT